jgi:purine-binding chemotaxis protein CheW
MEENITFSPENQYLTFFIGDDAFAIPIRNVIQVMKYSKPSKLPQTSEFISGIIPFRGEIVPVVDFYGNLNFIPNDYSIIIIAKIGEKKFGMIADSIYKIIEIKEKEIEKNISLSDEEGNEYIKGITSIDSIMLIVLDTEKANSIDNLSTLLKKSDFIKENQMRGIK